MLCSIPVSYDFQFYWREIYPKVYPGTAWLGEVPDSPVVGTLQFQCQGPGSFPGCRTKIPQAAWYSQNRKGGKKHPTNFAVDVFWYGFLFMSCSEYVSFLESEDLCLSSWKCSSCYVFKYSAPVSPLSGARFMLDFFTLSSMPFNFSYFPSVLFIILCMHLLSQKL